MAKATPLTDTQVKNLKSKDKLYKMPDGDNLYLFVYPSGTKTWKMRYVIDGKESVSMIGTYPEVSLRDARRKRDEIKKLVYAGINPNEEPIEEVDTRMTFRQASKEYLEQRDTLSDKYINDCTNILERDYQHIIGDKHLDDIKPVDIITILKGMEHRGIKTMTKKSFSLVNRIFRFAVTMQYTENNPTASIDLKLALKPHKASQFPHTTDPNVLRKILKSIDNYNGDIYTKTALQLMPYVFLRPTNIREATWDEIDFENKVWTISAEKMKMNRPHIIPLTDTVIEILNNVKNNRSKYVFPSPRNPEKMMSRDTLNMALKRMGYEGVMSAHGFRHTASTILHENMHKHNLSSDAIEMQMAHVDKNSIKGVYNKAMYVQERTRLMNWWTDYLNFLKL